MPIRKRDRVPTPSPKPGRRRRSGPPFAKRLKLGLLLSLGVGGLLFAFAFLAEGLPATDALALAAILGAFVLLVALGFHSVAAVYLGVMEALAVALVAIGAAAVAVLKIFG